MTQLLNPLASAIQNVTSTTAELWVVGFSFVGVRTVYARWRQGSTGPWTNLPNAGPNLLVQHTYRLTGLSPGTAYETEASFNSDFSGAVHADFTTLTMGGTPLVPSIAVSDAFNLTSTSAQLLGSGSNIVTNTLVHLRWRPAASAGAWNFLTGSITAANPTHTFTITGLTANRAYQVEVDLSSSFPSPVQKSFTTLATDPTPTIGLENAEITENSASIMLTAGGLPAGSTTVYARWRQGTSGSWTNLSAVTLSQITNMHTYVVGGLTRTTQYQFEASFNSDYSGAVTHSFTTGAGTPTILTAAPVLSSDSASIEVTLQNPAAGNTTVYTRWRQGTSGAWTNLANVTFSPEDNEETYTLAGLTPNTQYQFEASLNSDRTNASQRTFTTVISGLDVGTPVPGSDRASITVTGTNLPAANTTVYARWRQGTSGSWTNLPNQTVNKAAPSHTYTITGLTQNTQYQVEFDYRSDFSARVRRTFTTVVPTIGVGTAMVTDTTASLLVAAAHLLTGNTTVYARWRQGTSGAWTNLANQTFTPAANTHTYRLTGLTQNTQYQFEAALASDFTGAIRRSFTTQRTPTLNLGTPSATGNSASIAAEVSPIYGNTAVYARWRQGTSGAWTNLATRTFTFADFTQTYRFTGLTVSTQYQFEASLNSDFTGAIRRSFTTTATPDPTITVGEPSVMFPAVSASILVTGANLSVGFTTVYARWREGTSGAWTNLTNGFVTIPQPSYTFTIPAQMGGAPGLRVGRSYQFEASLASDFTGAIRKSFTTNPTLGVGDATVTGNTASLIATGTGIVANTTVYARWRQGTSGAWTNLATRTLTTTATTQTYRFTGLTVSTQYQFEASLNSDFTGAVRKSFTTSATPDPTIGVGPATDITHNGAFLLVAGANLVGGTTVYHRRRQGTSGAWSTLASFMLTPQSNTLNVQLTGLMAETLYQYEASLNSDFSGAIRRSFTTTAEPVIWGISFPTHTSTSLAFRVSVTGLRVSTVLYGRWRAGFTGPWTNLPNQTFSSSATEHTYAPLTGLMPNTQYSIQFATASDFSAASRVINTGVTTLGPPTIGVGEATVTGTTASLLVAGANIRESTTVYARWRQGSSGDWTTLANQILTQSANTHTYMLSGLMPSTAYQFEASLASDFTGAIRRSFTTLGPPDVPTNNYRILWANNVATADRFAVTGATRYQMRYRRKGTSTWTTSAEATTDRISTSTLMQNTVYEFQLRAGNDGGWSDWNDIRESHSPFTSSPAVPTGLGVTWVGSTGTVDWEDTPNATVYRLRYRVKADPANTWLNVDITNGVSAATLQLALSTTYEFQVRAGNSAGNSSYTATVESTSPATAPPLVRRLVVTQVFPNATISATVANAHASGTTLYGRYKVSTDSNWVTLPTRSVTPSNAVAVWQLSSLTASTTYDVEVSFESDFSPSAGSTTFTTPAGVPALSLTTSAITQTAATLTTTVQNPSEHGNVVYSRYKRSAGSTWTQLPQSTATPSDATESHMIMGLLAGTVYDFQASFNADYSSPVAITFATLQPPGVGEPSISASVAAVSATGFDVRVDVENPAPAGTRVYARYKRNAVNSWTPFTSQLATSGSPSLTFRATGLTPNTIYDFQASLLSSYGTLLTLQITTLPTGTGADLLALYLDHDGDGVLEDQAARVLSVAARWGSTGASYLDRVAPATLQVILRNSDEFYDINEIRVNSAMRLDARIDNVHHVMAGGYITEVDEERVPQTGQRRVIVTAHGVLHRLSQEDALFPIYSPIDRLTGDVVREVLEGSIEANRLRVSHSEVRVAPSQEEVIAEGLPSHIQVLRAMELAEGCRMNEGRGLDVAFPSRFERELLPAVSGTSNLFAIGERADAVPRVRMKNVRPEWVYRHLYTRVSLQGEQATLSLTNRHVLTWRKGGLADAPFVIRPGETRTLRAELNPRDRESEFFRGVASWAPVSAGGGGSPIVFESLAGVEVPSSDVTITPQSSESGKVHLQNVRVGQTFYQLEIRNRRTAPIRVKSFLLFGRTLSVLSDFAGPLVNAAAETTYGLRRTLPLGKVHYGSGFNGTQGEEVNGYLAYQLAKHGQPRRIARIEWDARAQYPGETLASGKFPHAMRQAAMINVGHRIQLQEGAGLGDLGDGLRAGIYFVEGGDLVINSQAGSVTAGLNISEPAYPIVRGGTVTTVTAASTTPVRVGGTLGLRAQRASIIAVRCSLPTGTTPDDDAWDEGDAVVEVADGVGSTREILKVWLERDIPIGTAGWITCVLAPGTARTLQVNVKRRTSAGPAVTVTETRLLEMLNYG